MASGPISSVQLLSHVQYFETPWIATDQSSLSIVNFRVYSNSSPLSQWCHPPSHPLSSPSPPAFNLSQHQGLFQWVSSSHQVAKVLDFQLQHQSFQWTLRTLGWTGWISLQSKGLSRVFSSTTVQNHQFFGTQLSLWSSSHIHSWLLEKPKLWLDETWLAK